MPLSPWPLALLELSYGRRQEPVVACNKVINGCKRSAAWNTSLELLSKLKQQYYEPNVVTYNISLSSCTRARTWISVLQLLEEVRQRLSRSSSPM